MENSKIEWTDSTFNPWIGCTKISAGCQHCYAEALMDKRYGRVKWGLQGTRQRTGASNWRKPLQWDKQTWEACAECGWRGPHHETHDFCPNCDGEDLRPTRQRVFCASLADVFEDNPQLIEWRIDMFRMIVHTPNLDWLLLTKRPENIMPMLDSMGWPSLMENVWIGASVEDQAAADKRIPELLKVPATVRFLSCEPLLGPVDLRPIWHEWNNKQQTPHGYCKKGIGFIDWIIAGGESGHGARPMSIDWASKLRYQATENGISFFMKQLGGISDKRHDLEDMPIGLRVREFPLCPTTA